MANLPETPQWDDGIYQIEVSDPVLGGPDGITNRPLKQLASRTLYLKQKTEEGSSSLAAHIAAVDPHTQYAPKISPVLTGTPTAPTAPQTTNNQQLATTAFVKAALAALVASSPAALDTLNELAAALGNDPNFATTMTNALANKQPLDNTLTALSGKTISGLLEYLRLGAGAFPIGMPFFWASAQTPDKLLPQWEGQVFLKWNDATFSATQYPLLALIIPSLRLSEARGEFPRILDDGRGVDSGRALLSVQGDAIRNITGSFYSRGGNATSSGAISIASGVFSFDGSATGDSSATLTVATSPQKPLEATRFSADAVVPTANENRPRNIAFNFLVRAK